MTSTETTPTLEAIERFNTAFNRHDVAEVMRCMTEDCVFDNTSPAPDGERFEGAAAVRAYWQKFFAENPQAHFEAEEQFAAGDRAVVRWRYDWPGGHVRGVDILRVRDGKVSEKFAYVKG